MCGKAAPEKAPDNLLRALQEAQTSYGEVTPEFMVRLAESLGVPESDVYGVATFYSFLATKPRGRYVIKICKNLPCHIKDGPAVIAALERETGVRPGNTTPDGRFSLELTNCIGLCDKAPAMLVNHDPHFDLTPDKIPLILDKYR
jgi:NADH-quinone oxidoreductase subunit E